MKWDCPKNLHTSLAVVDGVYVNRSDQTFSICCVQLWCVLWQPWYFNNAICEISNGDSNLCS